MTAASRCHQRGPRVAGDDVSREGSSVRPASEADAVAACDVLQRSIRELCVADHDHDEQVLFAWLANKTPENLREWISSPSSYAIVAVDCSTVRGFGLIQRDGEIRMCYLVPEVQYRGAGRLILRALEEQAARWGLTRVFLTSSITARRFYERNGYLQSGFMGHRHPPRGRRRARQPTTGLRRWLRLADRPAGLRSFRSPELAPTV